MHYATTDEHKEIIELLINNGADINAVDNEFGMTPLFSVAIDVQEDALCTLIENGAEVNISDNYGRTPIFRCCDEYEWQGKNC